jgi:carbon monoxide dehydrogenase subunit G
VNVHGTHDFSAPRERVFAAIRDPRVLLAVIPGCESVSEVKPDEYEGRINLRLPGAVGSYRTNVRMVDVHAPERSALEGRLEGVMGSISGRAEFTLREAGAGTTIEYQGTGLVQGPLAKLDSRLAERFAESLIDQGLSALGSRLAAEGTE